MARSTKHKLKETIAAAVDLAVGTARTIKGKAKELAGTGASRLAQAAAAAAVRLEADGQAEAAGAPKQTRAKQKSTGRAQAGTVQQGAKK